MFDEMIDENRENIVNTVSDLIKFPSVSNETGDSKYPFGKECADVLEKFLNLASKMGFRTKNIDGYCGYVEFGEGEELVGIIGHLDVVPANKEDGWTLDPFISDIRDGKLYGRGSIDDKGPVIAALYAMKAVMEKAKVNKRVRLIVGLNEEKDWKCIEYYKEKEEWPSIGFSPDANFPIIYAEKGILSVEVKNNFHIKGFEIEEINCNNNAINVVPKYCSITLKSVIDNSEIIEKLFKIKNEKIKVSRIDDKVIKIESYGTAAHAAHPELGENSIKNLVDFLIANFEFDTNYLKSLVETGFFEIESPKFMSWRKIEDESGILTSNVAIMEYSNGSLIFKINLRVPVTVNMHDITAKYEKFSKEYPDIRVKELRTQDPLYVKKDSKLVKTLVKIFNDKTELKEKPIAIGGGTYARAFDNCVAYGATMPGDMDMCHQVDEYVEIDKLILASKIYAEAIYELSK